MADKIDEGKILSFLFDKVEAGDNFEKAEELLRANDFSEDEINHTKNNFSSILEKCVEYHDVVKEELHKVTARAEKVVRASNSFDVISGVLYILTGIGLFVYFSDRLMEQTIFFSIGLVLFGAYKIYSGLQTYKETEQSHPTLSKASSKYNEKIEVIRTQPTVTSTKPLPASSILEQKNIEVKSDLKYKLPFQSYLSIFFICYSVWLVLFAKATAGILNFVIIIIPLLILISGILWFILRNIMPRVKETALENLNKKIKIISTIFLIISIVISFYLSLNTDWREVFWLDR